jgi:chromosome segregation ATPase
MKLRLFAVSAALVGTSLLGPLARAQNEIFLCVDEEGRKTYTNTGSTKGCKRQDVGPVTTVPAPRVPPSRNVASSNTLEQRATPANYPRVDGETQRSRDGDRRRILEDELRTEEDRVARLREEFNNGEPERRGDERNYARYQERVQRLQEDIQRGENNIVALRREIASLRQ